MVGKLLKPAEVAKLIGVSTYTLFSWRKSGFAFPYLRLKGNSIRYAEDSVRAWIESQQVSSIAEERAGGKRFDGAAESGGFA